MTWFLVIGIICRAVFAGATVCALMAVLADVFGQIYAQNRGRIFERLVYSREWLLLPLFVGFMLLAIRGVYWLTGRAPLDDPGELVSLSYRLIRVAFVIAFTGFTQGHLFGWRGEAVGATRWDHLLDALCSLALLLFFAFALWH